MFHIYKISGLLSGVLFALIFGSLSLDVIGVDIPVEVVTATTFALFFYAGLNIPTGEFFRKYIVQYRTLSVVPTLITLLGTFIVSLLLNFDTHIAMLLVLVFGLISTSLTSVAVEYLRAGELQKNGIYKLFFSATLPNNILIIGLFVTLLAVFDTGDDSLIGISLALGKVILFAVISIAVSRYIYPRVVHSLKVANSDINLVLLLINAVIQATIAHYLGLHYLIGALTASLFIPEKFLKASTLEPVLNRVGTINSYVFVPVLGLMIGTEIDSAILFDYDLFIPFTVLTVSIVAIQFFSSLITATFNGLSPRERKFIAFGSFAKTEIALLLLYISLTYGLIDFDIFTSSIILLGILNLFAWHNLKILNYGGKEEYE
jgi:Kef-type K+ transport system membrane component KefB